MSDVTFVTALFDLGREYGVDDLADYQRRPFEEYLTHFRTLLALDVPLSIYAPAALAPTIWRYRQPENTRVIVRETEDFRDCFPFFASVQQVRQTPEWRNQAAWLAESPQANLEFYNPVVMSKMAMLNDQQLINPFGTDKFLWIDAGLARTCGAYFPGNAWTRRIGALLERFLFICFPYIGGEEVHGFRRDALARLAGVDYIRRVARGGLFGGHREAIAEANAFYYRLLESSLAQSEMGTEESIFTAMSYLRPELFDRYDIDADGLIGPFLEALEQGPVPIIRTQITGAPPASAEPPSGELARPLEQIRVSLYILTFNQPGQLELLVASWQAQPAFLRNVIVLDNSTDAAALDANRQFCLARGFQHLPQGNLGICGGRQRAAELFAASEDDFMIFLEDDMLLGGPDRASCRAGFATRVDNLYDKLLKIMRTEGFDFLKLSFTEFYGINSEQWAWYNVPQQVRKTVWPDHAMLPRHGLAKRLPPVQFDRIGAIDGISYATGEVYYSNWPQIVSRQGNQRMFLDTTWAHPFEQTWMSHFFQLTREQRLRPAVLLASPIEHRRDYHYAASERRES